jgi:hypothetical protein
MPTRRDPDGWKRRAKADPWRRWFLKALATAVVGLSNLDGAIAFIERLFARRPAACSMRAEAGSYVIVMTPSTATISAGPGSGKTQVLVSAMALMMRPRRC